MIIFIIQCLRIYILEIISSSFNIAPPSFLQNIPKSDESKAQNTLQEKENSVTIGKTKINK